MGDTEGYGGTPPTTPGPGALPPGSAKPVQEVNDALKTMSEITSQNTQVMQALLQHLNRVGAAAKDTGKGFEYAHLELKSVLKDASNLEYSMKRIQKLRSAQIGLGAGRSGTAEYIKNLQAEYKVLLQVLNTGKGQGRFVKDIEKALEGLDRKLKQVQKQNDRTWDADQIREVNAELIRTAKHVQHVAQAMSTVQVGQMTKSFKEMGRAVDDAFSGQFSQILQRIPGVTGMLKGARFAKQAGVAHREISNLDSQRRSNLQQTWRANAANVYAKHGRAGLNTLRTMGYAGEAPTFHNGGRKTLRYAGGRWGAAPGAPSAPGANIAAKQGGALDQMTVKAMTVGRLVVGGASKASAGPEAATPQRIKARFDPQTGKFVDKATGLPVGEAPAAATPGRRKFDLSGLKDRFGASATPEEVQKTMQGSGGVFSRTLNKLVTGMAEKEGGGWMAKGAQSLLAKGAGSASAGLAEGAVGAGSGLLRGGLGLASRAAVPLAIAGSLIQLRDKIAEENKKIEGSFAGLGGFSTGGSADFHGIRKSLLSTGFTTALRMGQGQEENMKLMTTLGEGGLAVGGTLARGKDLGAALEDKGIGAHATQLGGGFYGSVMKNAVYNGRNLGMGQDASARLTMKLIEKFGQTTQETQKFFLGLDTMMQHSGVSASKYIEVIDDVTGQFNEMNRSLNSTLGILNALGKGGRLTGDTMRDLLKTLQAPTQMNTAQRMFNAMGMRSSGDASAAAESLRNSNALELQSLNEDLLGQGIGGKELLGEGGKDIIKNRTAIERRLAEKYADDPGELQAKTKALDEKIKRITTQSAQAQALASGNPAAIASVMEMGGESGASAMFARRSSVRQIGQTAVLSKDEMKRLLAGDQGMIQKVMSNQVVAQMQQQGTLMSGEDLVKYANASGNMARQGGLAAVGFAREGKNAQQLAGGDAQDKEKFNTMLQLQRARGKVVRDENGREDTDKTVQAFIDEATASSESADKLATDISQLDETFKLMVTTGSALQKAIQKQIDDKTADEAKAKATAMADNTRTTAEIFAKSFEYLFDKVINFLDKMMDFMNPGKWFAATKDSKQWAEGRVTNLRSTLEGMDTSKFTDEQKKVYRELLAKTRDGSLTTGSGSEVNQKIDEVAKTIDERLKKGAGSEALHEAYGAERVRGLSAMDTAYAKHGGYKDYKTLKDYIASYTDSGRLREGSQIGTALYDLVGDTPSGAGIRGSIEEMSKTYGDIQQTNMGDHVAVTTANKDAEGFMEALAKKFPDFVQAGGKDSSGKTIYNVYNSQHVLSQGTPSDAGKGSQAPDAKKKG